MNDRSVENANTGGFASQVNQGQPGAPGTSEPFGAGSPTDPRSGIRRPGDAPAGGSPAAFDAGTKFSEGEDGSLQASSASSATGTATDNTTRSFDPEKLQKHQIVRVYDHNFDGKPEFADIRLPDGTTAVHEELPEPFNQQPNATAPAVPIFNPAVCAATGLVVERHELVNGVVPEMNSPGIAYGEKSQGEGDQHIGQTMGERDMASLAKIHDRFKSLENKVFGSRLAEKAVPAQENAMRNLQTQSAADNQNYKGKSEPSDESSQADTSQTKDLVGSVQD